MIRLGGNRFGDKKKEGGNREIQARFTAGSCRKRGSGAEDLIQLFAAPVNSRRD